MSTQNISERHYKYIYDMLIMFIITHIKFISPILSFLWLVFKVDLWSGNKECIQSIHYRQKP